MIYGGIRKANSSMNQDVMRKAIKLESQELFNVSRKCRLVSAERVPLALVFEISEGIPASKYDNVSYFSANDVSTTD